MNSVDIWCNELYPDRKNSVQNTGTIPFTLSSKLWAHCTQF